MDINTEDQKLLLDVLLASVLYVNIKNEKPNPFVKSFGPDLAEKALKVLIKTIENSSHLFPLLEELSVEDKEVIDLTQYE